MGVHRRALAGITIYISYTDQQLSGGPEESCSNSERTAGGNSGSKPRSIRTARALVSKSNGGKFEDIGVIASRAVWTAELKGQVFHRRSESSSDSITGRGFTPAF